MCVVALKYFDKIGWVGVKNRDRNYKPTILIRQSHKDDIERLYIWDEKTKYTEGINEFGTSILSSATAVKNDEKEGDKENKGDVDEVFYSPDGKVVRTALLEKNIYDSVHVLVNKHIIGNTIVFNKNKAFLIEAAFKDKNDDTSYEYRIKEIDKDNTITRTNHGLFLKWMGYQYNKNDEHENNARISSETRLKKVREDIKNVKIYDKMLDCISDTSNINPQLNPLRIDNSRTKVLKTTGQLMIIPNEMTLYYRPIFCKVSFDFNKLDNPKSKTYFQILSSRKILKKNSNINYESLLNNFMKREI